MDSYNTALSAGPVLRSALLGNPALNSRLTQIFPVHAPEAQLPYICYRRKSLQEVQVKCPGRGADTATLELMVCAAGYDEGLELAEAVRATVDGYAWEDSAAGMQVRMCHLINAEEYYEADAYIQLLTFNIKVNKL